MNSLQRKKLRGKLSPDSFEDQAALYRRKFKCPGGGKLHEANAQAEFYCLCKKDLIPCVLEWTTPVGRVDIALFNPARSKLISVIEVKEAGCASDETDQFAKYRTLGVPVYLLNGMENVWPLYQRVKQEYWLSVNNENGVEIPAVKSAIRIKLPPKPKPIRVLYLDEDLIIRS